MYLVLGAGTFTAVRKKLQYLEKITREQHGVQVFKKATSLKNSYNPQPPQRTPIKYFEPPYQKHLHFIANSNLRHRVALNLLSWASNKYSINYTVLLFPTHVFKKSV